MSLPMKLLQSLQELKEQVQILTDARDQLMDKMQTLKQNQSQSATENEETLLMLNEKNQGLQEMVKTLEKDKQNTEKEIADFENRVKVCYSFFKLK